MNSKREILGRVSTAYLFIGYTTYTVEAMARGRPRSAGLLSCSGRNSSAEAGASLAPGWLANRFVEEVMVLDE
jgi:hypothetical protein